MGRAQKTLLDLMMIGKEVSRDEAWIYGISNFKQAVQKLLNKGFFFEKKSGQDRMMIIYMKPHQIEANKILLKQSNHQ